MTSESRINMITQQLRTDRHIDDRIAQLFNEIPREHFIPEAYRKLAYSDQPLPLEGGQMTLTPLEEARILQAVSVKSKDRILQLGVAGGYLTALLARLGQHVFCLDAVEAQITSARQQCGALGLNNIEFAVDNPTDGWTQAAPFDVIVVTGSMAHLSDRLCRALAIQGRLFVIIGASPAMQAMLVTRVKENQWTHVTLFETDRMRLSGLRETDGFKF